MTNGMGSGLKSHRQIWIHQVLPLIGHARGRQCLDNETGHFPLFIGQWWFKAQTINFCQVSERDQTINFCLVSERNKEKTDLVCRP